MFSDLLPQEVDCHCTIARKTPWMGQTSLSRCIFSDCAPERESEARTPVAVFLLSCEIFLGERWTRPTLNLPQECLALDMVCQPSRECCPSRPADSFFPFQFAPALHLQSHLSYSNTAVGTADPPTDDPVTEAIASGDSTTRIVARVGQMS